MAQNVVLCLDGTNCEFGTANTNVVRVLQSLNRDVQKVYYDPGVGTLPDPRMFTKIGKTITEAIDLAFAMGLQAKVMQAYQYLMQHWEPGDTVFMFGFSRGAYTARVLAGMLHLFGLLPRGNEHLVHYVMRLYGGSRHRKLESDDNKTDLDDRYWKLCNGFREAVARRTTSPQRRFPVHFLGLWDTVSSVGWVWSPLSYPFTRENESVAVVRHAISIDESRAFFRQNCFKVGKLPAGQDCQEYWFPGCHADVVGGHEPGNSHLGMVTFDWMIREAKLHDLEIDEQRLRAVREPDPEKPLPENLWNEPMVESLTGAWHLAEFFPKQHYVKEADGYRYYPNLYRPRTIHKGALIHKSALLRVKAEKTEKGEQYRPRNFSPAFIERILQLSEIPETLALDNGDWKYSLSRFAKPIVRSRGDVPGDGVGGLIPAQ